MPSDTLEGLAMKNRQRPLKFWWFPKPAFDTKDEESLPANSGRRMKKRALNYLILAPSLFIAFTARRTPSWRESSSDLPKRRRPR